MSGPGAHCTALHCGECRVVISSSSSSSPSSYSKKRFLHCTALHCGECRVLISSSSSSSPSSYSINDFYIALHCTALHCTAHCKVVNTLHWAMPPGGWSRGWVLHSVVTESADGSTKTSEPTQTRKQTDTGVSLALSCHVVYIPCSNCFKYTFWWRSDDHSNILIYDLMTTLIYYAYQYFFLPFGYLIFDLARSDQERES